MPHIDCDNGPRVGKICLSVRVWCVCVCGVHVCVCVCVCMCVTIIYSCLFLRSMHTPKCSMYSGMFMCSCMQLSRNLKTRLDSKGQGYLLSAV